ncbi:hypothetical protein M3210_13750 [Oceanobacillus luteolus]|uniref:hypothetical protein n=1 Tax=Oceanobacillus luteolus TaxID=1274358 RepID=UPI00203EBB1E|nr:hypothetical protein [Oceanobacillus luteolus]MCM3741333.1 hypothetical protein [Oceanobacillus luteolus]
MKKSIMNLLSLLMIVTLVIAIFPNMSSAASEIHITNISGTTTPSTTSKPKDYLHFYSSKDTVKVNIKVDQWIKTKSNKTLHVELQKSNGIWWSKKASRTLKNTSPITFTHNGGPGDYRLVIYDAHERTMYDKPPLYYAKSTKYSGKVTGY